MVEFYTVEVVYCFLAYRGYEMQWFVWLIHESLFKSQVSLSFFCCSCLAFFPLHCTWAVHGLRLWLCLLRWVWTNASASPWTWGCARQLLAGCFRVSLVQCCCWDDSFFLPVGFIDSGCAVVPGMKQESVWSAQTLGKVCAAPCRYTLWAPVCKDWILCWRWVPVTATHWGAAQTCMPTSFGGTSGDDLLHPCFVKARPTSILAQVSQNLSIRVLYCNLPNPECLCEAVLARVQPAGCRKWSFPSTQHWSEVRWSTESSFVFLSTRKALTTWSKSNGGATRVIRGGASVVEGDAEAAVLF